MKSRPLKHWVSLRPEPMVPYVTIDGLASRWLSHRDMCVHTIVYKNEGVKYSCTLPSNLFLHEYTQLQTQSVNEIHL